MTAPNWAGLRAATDKPRLILMAKGPDITVTKTTTNWSWLSQNVPRLPIYVAGVNCCKNLDEPCEDFCWWIGDVSQPDEFSSDESVIFRTLLPT